jgi:uncharacterized protein (DUF2062 family)
MLFGRRNPAGWWEKVRISMWPRRSWGRSVSYVSKRIMRLTGSPHAVAAGVAAGVFASFTPYMGFHFLLAFFVAYVVGGNFIAAALGTFIGNPLTFPFIWASTYATGKFILSGSHAHAQTNGAHSRLGELGDAGLFTHGVSGLFERAASLWEPVIKPMTIGAVPLGVGFAILFYVLTRKLAVAFQARRRAVLARRQADKAEAAPAGSEPASP